MPIADVRSLLARRADKMVEEQEATRHNVELYVSLASFCPPLPGAVISLPSALLCRRLLPCAEGEVAAGGNGQRQAGGGADQREDGECAAGGEDARRCVRGVAAGASSRLTLPLLRHFFRPYRSALTPSALKPPTSLCCILSTDQKQIAYVVEKMKVVQALHDGLRGSVMQVSSAVADSESTPVPYIPPYLTQNVV